MLYASTACLRIVDKSLTVTSRSSRFCDCRRRHVTPFSVGRTTSSTSTTSTTHAATVSSTFFKILESVSACTSSWYSPVTLSSARAADR